MNSNNTINASNVGNAIWQQLQNAMPTTPVEEFGELHDLKDLAGNSTGSIEVLTAPNLVKMSLLSINMGPGRYFNIHVIPQANLQVPRFLFEGMAMPGSSQLSLDLFPDTDVFMETNSFLELYSDIIPVYTEARMESVVSFEASRQAHMRAFSSPVFLCAFQAPDEHVEKIEDFAHRYLDAWLKILSSPEQLDAEATATREKRRKHMQESIIDLDPDRNRVVAVYGEKTTRNIELASML